MTTTRPQTDVALNRLLKCGLSLPALPTTGVELLSLMQKPVEAIDVKRLAGLIEGDPALAARLLRMANSPYYGLMGRITSINYAIMLIGLEETIHSLNFHLMANAMPKCPELDRFYPDQFWIHSWATGFVARQFGQPKYLIDLKPGDLYLAGLLHDLGKIACVIHMPDEYSVILDLAASKGMAVHEAETRVLGMDHGQIGAHLLQRWRLPDAILQAVAFHHDPQAAPPMYRELAGLTEYADAIAHRSGIGESSLCGDLDLDATWLRRQYEHDAAHPAISNQAVEEVVEALRSKARIMHYLDEDEEGHASEGTSMSRELPLRENLAGDSEPSSMRTRRDEDSPSLMRRLIERIYEMLEI